MVSKLFWPVGACKTAEGRLWYSTLFNSWKLWSPKVFAVWQEYHPAERSLSCQTIASYHVGGRVGCNSVDGGVMLPLRGGPFLLPSGPLIDNTLAHGLSTWCKRKYEPPSSIAPIFKLKCPFIAIFRGEHGRTSKLTLLQLQSPNTSSCYALCVLTLLNQNKYCSLIGNLVVLL